ncbi:MAG: AI-2E family transporter [Saprospiraceae bacterium]|nr:AI-2E family transporter [Saprospiraceae bacterium]MCB0622826.1 AI-2E family transporter [Saprospiraceae bacterium]MCB0678027.1 AI-2E family transporter [Saprospiraceae bacterium]MCB0682969.1 AI-2E family transporter [Saprospiraceae bacterium]
MRSPLLNLQQTAYFLLTFCLLGYLLIIGQSLLSPLVFALFLTSLLIPLCRWVERWVPWRGAAILATFLLVLLPVLAVLFLFSWQFAEVVQNIPAISGQLRAGVDQIFSWLQAQFGLSRAEGQQWLADNLSKVLDAPLAFLGKGISSSTSTLLGIGLGLLYLFFFLYYRTAFRNFLLIQFRPDGRDEAKALLGDIQRIGRGYLYGLLLVILILGVLNSLGLWLIGIEYPVFWGSLAACLTVIPYIGTTLGGAFPFLFALATTNTWWQPAAVVGMYFLLQQLEGNLITPNVIGSKVRINAFAAIFSLVLGGTLWGISGMILALPMVAVLKVTLEQFEATQPLALLLGRNPHRHRQLFFDRFDEDRFRLLRFFRED